MVAMLGRQTERMTSLAIISSVCLIVSLCGVDAFSAHVRSGRKVPSVETRLSSSSSSDVTSGKAVDAVVVGGGPAGLLSAVMYAKKFPEHKVEVFERLPAPPSPTDEAVWSQVAKFYLIGLGARGQKALAEFGVWEDVERYCIAVVGRKDWAPDAAIDEGVERIFTDRPYTTQVLPRDKLVGVLHEHILENFSDRITLNYGSEVTPISFGSEADFSVVLSVTKCGEEVANADPSHLIKSDGEEAEILCDPDTAYTLSTNLLIAADGTARTIAAEIERDDEKMRKAMDPVQRLVSGKPFKVTRYFDDNQRVYKTIPMKLPRDWRSDLNYSTRTKGSLMNLDALPADADGAYCAALLLTKDDDLAAPNVDTRALRDRMDDLLPQFSQLIDDETISAVAKKPPSNLPSFRYVGPRLHHLDRTVIIGDCAHTVKPYFGLGANTALQDVQVLGEAMDESTSIGESVRLYSEKRAGEAEALVKLSRELDRPGKLGFVTFILPLILDSVFHRLAPSFFGENILSMLQREDIDFRGVRRRKRMDRLKQMVVLGGALTAMSMAARYVVSSIARVTGRAGTTAVAALTAMTVGTVIARKFAFFFLPGLAPADVLAKTDDKVAGGDTFISEYTKKDKTGNSEGDDGPRPEQEAAFAVETS